MGCVTVCKCGDLDLATDAPPSEYVPEYVSVTIGGTDGREPPSGEPTVRAHSKADVTDKP